MNQPDNANPTDNSQQQPQAELRKGVAFEPAQADNEADALLPIRPSQQLEDSYFVQLTEDNEVPSEPVPVHSKKAGKGVWLAVVIILLAVIELGMSVYQVFTQQDWLGAAWLAVLVVIIGAAGWALIGEFKGLRALRRSTELQQQAEPIYSNPGMGLARDYCLQVSEKLPDDIIPAVTTWQDGLQPHFNDKEIMTLFERQVMSKADQKALQSVSSQAAASAALIAVSPFALMDMVLVLWRNLKMLNTIADCYGLHLGYWSRIALIKQVVRNMLYAGATEILSDTANYAMGTSLTGKVSTRVAQGMSAGLYTARLGIRAMHEIRPMPWLSVAQPKMSAISQQLLNQLKSKL